MKAQGIRVRRKVKNHWSSQILHHKTHIWRNEKLGQTLRHNSH